MSAPMRHNKPPNRSAFQPYRLLSPHANLLFSPSNPNPTTPILTSPMQASNPILSSNLLLQQLQAQSQQANQTLQLPRVQNKMLSDVLAKMVGVKAHSIL